MKETPVQKHTSLLFEWAIDGLHLRRAEAASTDCRLLEGKWTEAELLFARLLVLGDNLL